MTSSESSHKDVDATVVGLVLFEVGVDNFKSLVVDDSYLLNVEEWVR